MRYLLSALVGGIVLATAASPRQMTPTLPASTSAPMSAYSNSISRGSGAAAGVQKTVGAIRSAPRTMTMSTSGISAVICRGIVGNLRAEGEIFSTSTRHRDRSRKGRQSPTRSRRRPHLRSDAERLVRLLGSAPRGASLWRRRRRHAVRRHQPPNCRSGAQNVLLQFAVDDEHGHGDSAYQLGLGIQLPGLARRLPLPQAPATSTTTAACDPARPVARPAHVGEALRA